MSTPNRALYWGITGALLGFGFIGSMTIGAPFLVIGAVMLVYGGLRVGETGMWGLVIGLGALPAFFFLSTYFVVERCAPGTVLSLPADAPSGTRLSCGQVPQSYLYFGALSALTVLLGIAWGMSAAKRGKDSKPAA